MTVYVDDVELPYGRMLMCHMWADTLDELLEMADIIGVNRGWMQSPPKASWIHFDIAKAKKAIALENGAVLTDRLGPSYHATPRLRQTIARARKQNGSMEKYPDQPNDPVIQGPPPERESYE